MKVIKTIKITKRNDGRTSGNRKVAKNRGASWRAGLMKGKHEAFYNPTPLRLLRLKKKVNQDALAKKIGVSAASYGSIERGKRLVSSKRASLIAQKVGVPLSKIFMNPIPGKDKLLAIVSK